MNETIRQTFARLMAQCEAGFDNEHHWLKWREKYGKQIRFLPPPLRESVLLAWDQAECKVFGKRQPRAAPQETSE